MAQIVSVSRRQDVPAFRAEWFEERLRQGFAMYRNPFRGTTHEVSLKRDDVLSFVFWSKDFSPFSRSLDSVHSLGYPFLCHFTINGYPAAIEPRVPPASSSTTTFRKMAASFGPERMTWRFDPILVTSVTDERFHLDNFARIAAALEGSTSRCVISFASIYAKVRRNLDRLRETDGIAWTDPEPGRRAALAQSIAGIAAGHGMSVSACCTPDVVGGSIARAACVDADLIGRLFGGGERTRKNPTRKGCGCSDSRDIGEYGACGHGCVYCYANPARASRPGRATP